MGRCRNNTDKGKSNYLKKKQFQRHAVHKKKVHTDCAWTEIGHPQGRKLSCGRKKYGGITSY